LLEIEEEKQKKLKWRKENERRRHNYFGMIYKLLEVASQKGVLEEMFNSALEKEEKQRQEKQEKKSAQAH